jgi:capsular polysaccharide biosynthesis protein
MSTPRFDLVDIVQTLRKRFAFIMIVTFVAAVIGVAFHYLGKKEFAAKAEFFVSNPLLTDRNTIYGGADSRIDYFGDEDDVDRVLALAESDTVIMKVLLESGLAHEMDKDLIDARNIFEMKEYYRRHFEITRTEYTLVEVSFTDKDPIRAARITNIIVSTIEQAYRSFYNTRRTNIFASLTKKYTEQDSMINVFTDTLAKIRDRTGIYDLVSPNRNNIINGTINPRGSASGKDIEVIQNIEALKDGMVIDQSRIASLLQQFTTGTGAQQLEMFQVISRARQPIVPKGLTGMMTLIASCMIGFFFSVFFILITTYYKKIVAVER